MFKRWITVLGECNKLILWKEGFTLNFHLIPLAWKTILIFGKRWIKVLEISLGLDIKFKSIEYD